MNKGIFNAISKNGVVNVVKKQEMFEFMRSIEGRISIVISKHRPVRSNGQNRLWWKFCTWAGGELGYTKDEMSSTFKAMFITDRTSGLPVIPSTSTLNTMEMSELYSHADRAMAELGYSPPKKDELLAMTGL